MGKKSRNKGAVGEREIASLLRPVFPDAHRRSSGEESQDDQGRDLDGTPGLCAQVRRAARTALIETKVNEALEASKPGEMAVAFTRVDRGEWLATMPLLHWMSVWDAYARRRREQRIPDRGGEPGGSDPSGEAS